MKKLIYMLAAAALVSAGAVSCSDEKTDDPVEPVTVSSSMRLNGGNVLVNVPEADFDVSIPDEASSWVGVNEAETEGRTLVLEVAKNETGAERQTTVTVTRKGRSDLLATVTIKQSNVAAKNGEFVIEEIYFTGTALPETGRPDKYQGDQYIKIRNNTDEDLYADGMLLILQSSVLSNMEGEIPAAVDFREEYCAGQAFYAIPGSGRDVPVKAGESLIIVNNAQNHLESNPDSWDATTADFEWYDESSNENFLDTDNPAVPNLDKWYAQTLTVHSLHNRGAYGIAIAMPPAGTTGEQFLQDHPIGDGYYYIFHSPNGSDYEMPIKGYFVPNKWVLDAVNTGGRNTFGMAPWGTSLDAGYTWCGTEDSDPDQFNKSVIRKTGADGKLVDTNNSSNDFTPNTTPSLLAK